jgi:hypothetical protein
MFPLRIYGDSCHVYFTVLGFFLGFFLWLMEGFENGIFSKHSSSPPRCCLLKSEVGRKWDIHNHKQVLNGFTMPVLDSLNNFRSAMAMNARRFTIMCSMSS